MIELTSHAMQPNSSVNFWSNWGESRDERVIDDAFESVWLLFRSLYSSIKETQRIADEWQNERLMQCGLIPPLIRCWIKSDVATNVSSRMRLHVSPYVLLNLVRIICKDPKTGRRMIAGACFAMQPISTVILAFNQVKNLGMHTMADEFECTSLQFRRSDSSFTRTPSKDREEIEVTTHAMRSNSIVDI